MNPAIPACELSWVQVFFSGRNHLRWEDIETQAAPARALGYLMPWLKKLAIGGGIDPVVLPLYDQDGRITWYGMSTTDRRFAQMIDEITGFVGPSYSNFCGDWADLDLDDVQERALADRFGSRVIRFSAAQALDQPEIESALDLYLAVLGRRPEIQDRTQRPFGKIRSDFDRALLAGNADSAQILVDELLSSGRLNAEQRKCLEIRLLAGLGLRETLAKNSALISSVADVSLPAQTLVDIVTALYDTYIAPIESAISAPEVIEVFRKQIFKPFGGLFRERKGIRRPEILRAFLLSELAVTAPNELRCRTLLDSYPKNAEGYDLAVTWYELLNKKVTESDAKSSWLSEAKQAIADEDYETASERCFRLLPLPWAYSAMLRCAIELDEALLTQLVLDSFSKAPESLFLDLTEKDRFRYDKLRGVLPSGSRERKSGWIIWAKSVLKNPLMAPTVAELQEMATKWSVDEYANDTTKCEALAHSLVEASGKAQDVFRDAFPVLVGFFETGFGTRRAFRPIYATLIKFLGWSGSLSQDELEIGAQLMLSLLTNGPSDAEYVEALEDLDEILKANASPVHFDWGLNLSELVLQYPSPDQGAAKLRFFLTVIGMLQTAPHRVTVGQKSLLAVLARDYNCPGLLDTFPGDGTDQTRDSVAYASYSGLVGIYTLTEGAGQRAKEVLERLFPKATVELNNDTVSTDRLISLAKNADIFVFAWKSSKHQAYYCVKEARQQQDILLPLGKGSASILSSVLDKISNI